MTAIVSFKSIYADDHFHSKEYTEGDPIPRVGEFVHIGFDSGRYEVLRVVHYLSDHEDEISPVPEIVIEVDEVLDDGE